MDAPANIGASIRIKGEVSAREPLTIAGRVDGSVTVEGHAVTIAVGAQVTATVAADAIIVAGTVKGRLNATVRVVIDESASIDGDVTAPAVRLADGATLHGRIETGERKRSMALAS